MSDPIEPTRSDAPEGEEEIVELQFASPDSDEAQPTDAPASATVEPNRSADHEGTEKPKRAWMSHAWFLFLCLGVIVASVSMKAPDEEHVFLPGAERPIPGSCMSREYLGIACPGCGLTRSFISIGHFRFDRAWHFNPASFLVYAFVLFQIPWQSFQLYLTWRNKQAVYWRKMDHLLWVMAAALVLQWLVRGFSEGFWHPPS